MIYVIFVRRLKVFCSYNRELHCANMRVDPGQDGAEAEFPFDNRLDHKIIGNKRIF